MEEHGNGRFVVVDLSKDDPPDLIPEVVDGDLAWHMARFRVYALGQHMPE